MKKFLIIPVLVLMVSGIVAAQTISFPDVKTTDWFYKDVMNMVEWGVIKGNDDGTFKPGNNVNRAELSAMWNRYDQRVTSNRSFEDDKLRYAIIQILEQNASLYENLASIYSITTTNPSCTFIKYYYDGMKEDYKVAKNLSDMMSTPGLKIDSTIYDQKLSDYRLVNDQCTLQ